MKLRATGFSNTGTLRKTNQDSVLLQDHEISSGSFDSEFSGNARFFVADGVGGAPAGEIASAFVLMKLNESLDKNSFPTPSNIETTLQEINKNLFDISKAYPENLGMATTLSGLFFSADEFRVVNAGDSRVLLLRDGELNLLTTDHALKLPSGLQPITSFFGGVSDSLYPDISTETEKQTPGDIFMVSTDGIFRCLSIDQLGKILSNSKTLREKSNFILNKSLQQGAPDNISCIFIEITEKHNF